MLTLKEVKEHGLIKDNILNTIPERCQCGSEILISESLTEVQCSNPNCKFKVLSKTIKFLKYLDINDWSQSELEQVIEKYKIITPYQFMILSELIDELKLDIKGIKQKIDNIEKIKHKKFHLWQIVKYADIPYISSIAYELFGSYDSIEKAYNDIELEQVSFLAEKLGINSNEPSVIAMLVYNKLLEVKDELLFGELQFNIIKYSINPIKIVIATSINEFINKYEYMEYLNTRYKDRLSFVLESKISSDTLVLINEKIFDSLKYRTAKRVNEEYIKESLENNLFKHGDIGKSRGVGELLKVGEKIAILTGQELIERLDKMLDEKDTNIYSLINNQSITDSSLTDSSDVDNLDELSNEEIEELYNELESEDNSDLDLDLDELSDEDLEDLINDLEE